MTGTIPREGMMAVIGNRRAMISGVQPYDAAEAGGRCHLVEVEYTDGTGAESDEFLWEVEPGTELLEPSLPPVQRTPPMDPRELDAIGAGVPLVGSDSFAAVFGAWRRPPSPWSCCCYKEYIFLHDS